ncbi:unnamed protein product [Musa hybrid cultivar]
MPPSGQLPPEKTVDGRASLVTDPRRRHGHAYRGVLLLRLQRPPLRLLVCRRDPLADATHRGRSCREHHRPPAVVVAGITTFGVFDVGGSLGHDEAPPAANRGTVSDADTAEEGSRYGE